MRRVFLLVVALTAGCLDPVVPRYQLSSATSPSPLPPTSPTPPPNPTPPAPLFATLSVGPSNPFAGSRAAFTAYVSPAPTEPALYRWSFGDGETGLTGIDTTSHTYGREGSYDASVIVSDAIGRATTARASVKVREAPDSGEAPDPNPAPTLSAAVTCTTIEAATHTIGCNVAVSYGVNPVPSAAVTPVTWDWGDGWDETWTGLDATTQSYPYPFAGTYTLVVKVTATTTDGVVRTATTSKVNTVP